MGRQSQADLKACPPKRRWDRLLKEDQNMRIFISTNSAIVRMKAKNGIKSAQILKVPLIFQVLDTRCQEPQSLP